MSGFRMNPAFNRHLSLREQIQINQIRRGQFTNVVEEEVHDKDGSITIVKKIDPVKTASASKVSGPKTLKERLEAKRKKKKVKKMT